MRYYFKTTHEDKRNNRTWQNLKYLFKDVNLLDGTVDSLIDISSSIEQGDTIYFYDFSMLKDDFSSMNQLVDFYMDCYKRGIELCFINTPGCDTKNIENLFSIFKSFIDKEDRYKYIRNIVNICGDCANNGRNMAFDLKSASLQLAKDNGTVIGKRKGSLTNDPNVEKIKSIILSNAKTFGGKLSDKEIMEQFNIKRTTFYKYKKHLKEEKPIKSMSLS